jgi:hypothetical protein
MKNTFTLILVFLLPFLAFSQKAEHRNLENKLAIQGYDPVSYIEQKKAVKGKRICGQCKRSHLLYFFGKK